MHHLSANHTLGCRRVRHEVLKPHEDFRTFNLLPNNISQRESVRLKRPEHQFWLVLEGIDFLFREPKIMSVLDFVGNETYFYILREADFRSLSATVGGD